jgi:hypothetical protein
MTFRRWGFSWILILFLSLPAWAQSVISARSGLIHFSEGSVFLDGQRIQQAFGRFDQMKDGSELRTEEGRAEVILTPGMFLRLGGNTAIRMVSSHLQDTRVELLNGSAVVESENAPMNGPVTILYSDYQVQLREPGRCRIDSVPAQLRVENGSAEVFRDGASVVINSGYALPFSGDLVAQKVFFDERADALDSWNQARTNWISQSNSDTGNATDLSAAMESWQNDPDAFLRALGTSAYIPPLGYTSPRYPPLSSYGARPSYYPLIGPGLSSPHLSPWGIGAGSPFFVYPRPVFGYYPYRYSGSSGLGSSALPRHGALGTGPYNHPPTAVRPGTPIHSSPGHVGHIGGHR